MDFNKRKVLKTMVAINSDFKRFRLNLKITQTNNRFSINGFTLIEVMLILLILGFLLTGISVYYKSSVEFSRTKSNEANIQRIEGAALLYRIDTGSFPICIEDLISQPESVAHWQGPYINEIPSNPFNPGQPYQLNSNGKVISY